MLFVEIEHTFRRNMLPPSSALFTTCFHTGSLLGSFFDPEGDMLPETSVKFQRTARRYNLEDITFHNRSCENLKSYIISRWCVGHYATFTC
jgi:hypothetical protein